MNKYRRIILLLCTAIVVAFLFWYSSVLQDAFYLIADYLSVLAFQNELLAIFVFILVAVLAALVSPLTNVPLIPVAVLIWGPASATIFLLIGWIIGDILAYFIGYYFGHKVASYFVSNEKLDNWSRVVKERTHFSTALFLRLALPAELGYAFGIIRYPAGAYVLVTFLAELPFAFVSTYASEAVLYGEALKFFGLIGILAVIIFVAYRMNHKRRAQ